MREVRNGLLAALLATGWLGGWVPLLAQGTNLGTVRGTVTDAQGAVVPGAAVQVIDQETGLLRALVTDNQGNYEAVDLKPGRYKVTVTLSGFTTAEITGVDLHAGAVARVDARLQLKGLGESLTVTSEAPLIQTETQTIGGTIESRALLELPRDNRDIYSFLYLNPNITQSDSDGGFKFIGAQSYGANFSLDGQRASGALFGEPTASQPSLETIGELTVLSNNYSAEYAGIANIRVVTARGGRNHHGSLFYNNKNSALAAWTLDDKIAKANFLPTSALAAFPNPFFNLNEAGGSFSGPLPFGREKTFFLVAYEHRWLALPVQFRSTNRLPHATILSGDFRRLNDTSKPVVPSGVTLSEEELAANTILVGGTRRFVTIPARLLNPVTSAIIKQYFPVTSPLAPINPVNGRLDDYFENVGGRLGRDLATVRLDHDFSARDKVYGVYNFSTQDNRTAAVVNPFPGLGLRLDTRDNHTLSFSYTRIIEQNIVNEARGGFNRQNSYRRSNQTLRQFLSGVGLDERDIATYGEVVGPEALDTYGHPQISLGNYQGFTSGGRNTNRISQQSLVTFGDTLTWLVGRHSIRIGADLVRNQAKDGFVNNRGFPRGALTYGGNNSANPVVRFLLGLPADSVNYVDRLRPPLDVANWEHGYFIQDDFKVHPRFTLNLGLRYELITPFVDKNDLMVNFDPDSVDPTTGRRGRFVAPAARTLPFMDPRMIAYGVVTADQIGLGRGLMKADRNNFAPRLGAAWRVGKRNVLRGGFGVAYPTAAAQGMRDAMESSPFNQGRRKRNTNPPLAGWPGFSHGFSPLTGGLLDTVGGAPSANSIPFRLQSPRVEQYNVTFEQELRHRAALRASYLGTRMRGLIAGVDLNMLPPGDAPFGTSTGDGMTACDPTADDCQFTAAELARRPFPELGAYMARYGNRGRGRLHALQFEVNQRFAGFVLNASYTWLDQKSDGLDTANSSLGGTLYNQFQPGLDFARDAFVSRHRFITYGIFEIPYGRGRRFGASAPAWADAAIGGWQLTWNMVVKSGAGFTPYWECDGCSVAFPGNLGSDFVDALGGFGGTSFRPLVIGNPYRKVGDKIFDAAAFAPPPVGSDLFTHPQVAKRNILTGPGTWGTNLGISKKFKVTERVIMQVAADFNNVFNHPLLAPNNPEISRLGSFTLKVDTRTRNLLPIAEVTPNPDFGRLRRSYSQEGIDNRRSVRLKLQLTF